MTGHHRAGKSSSYECSKCHRVSHNAVDIQEQYCGFCHEFEQERTLKKRLDLHEGLAEASRLAHDLGLSREEFEKRANEAYCKDKKPWLNT